VSQTRDAVRRAGGSGQERTDEGKIRVSHRDLGKLAVELERTEELMAAFKREAHRPLSRLLLLKFPILKNVYIITCLPQSIRHASRHLRAYPQCQMNPAKYNSCSAVDLLRTVVSGGC
jgi:hypothetical protein